MMLDKSKYKSGSNINYKVRKKISWNRKIFSSRSYKQSEERRDDKYSRPKGI